MITKISDLFSIIKNKKRKKLVLAVAEDASALEAVVNAVKKDIIEGILVGDAEKINQIAKKENLDISSLEIFNETDITKAANLAVKLVVDKKADILMKGKIPTAVLLRAVLNKELGLRQGGLLSHLAVFEMKNYHKLLCLTDAAINIAPDLQGKIDIINNSVDYLRKLGYDKPKVAVLAAVEVVNPSMPATIHASMLSKMSERNQISNCIIDGPLAFDNAVDKESADYKGIVSNVAGDVDLLLAPSIEVANALYKTFIIMADAKCAGVIVGAMAPIVLTSRSDSEETKLSSIALAAAIV